MITRTFQRDFVAYLRISVDLCSARLVQPEAYLVYRPKTACWDMEGKKPVDSQVRIHVQWVRTKTQRLSVVAVV